MKGLNNQTQTAADDRPPRRQAEQARATAEEDLPLDHHVEEVLAALSDLASLHGARPRRRQSRR